MRVAGSEDIIIIDSFSRVPCLVVILVLKPVGVVDALTAMPTVLLNKGIVQ